MVMVLELVFGTGIKREGEGFDKSMSLIFPVFEISARKSTSYLSFMFFCTRSSIHILLHLTKSYLQHHVHHKNHCLIDHPIKKLQIPYHF